MEFASSSVWVALCAVLSVSSSDLWGLVGGLGFSLP